MEPNSYIKIKIWNTFFFTKIYTVVFNWGLNDVLFSVLNLFIYLYISLDSNTGIYPLKDFPRLNVIGYNFNFNFISILIHAAYMPKHDCVQWQRVCNIIDINCLT